MHAVPAQPVDVPISLATTRCSTATAVRAEIGRKSLGTLREIEVGSIALTKTITRIVTAIRSKATQEGATFGQGVLEVLGGIVTETLPEGVCWSALANLEVVSVPHQKVVLITTTNYLS